MLNESNDGLKKTNEKISSEKNKLEQIIEDLRYEMQQINQTRYEEEQQLKELLDLQELNLERMKKQLEHKEAEIRRLLIVESNMKT